MSTRLLLKLTSISISSSLVFSFPAQGLAFVGDVLDVRALNSPDAPVYLQNCRGQNGGSIFYATDLNRSTHDLLSVETEYKIYDREGTLIGDGIDSLPLDNPLSSNDFRMLGSHFMSINLSEPANSISYATCKIIKATFMGRHEWKEGQRWSEALLPMPKPRPTGGVSDAPGQAQPDAVAGTPAPP